jgi:hypothetical protein
MSLAPPKPDPAAALSLSAAQALWPQPALRVVPTNFRTFRSLTCSNGKHGRGARREGRTDALPSVLRNLPIVVDDPVGRAAPSPSPRPGEADVIIIIIIIGRPDRPSYIVAPNRNLPRTSGPGPIATGAEAIASSAG